MKKTVLLLFCFILTLKIYSQYSYYKEATVIKNNDQRFQGYVERISESKLNPKIKFKTEIESKNIEEIPVTEIKDLIFLSDSSIFQCVRYEVNRDSIKWSEMRLAKKLADGYAQLYNLQLPEEELSIIFENDNTWVYILQIENEYYVLNQEEIISGTTYKLKKNYQARLIYLLKDYKDLQDRARNLKFSDKQFISIIDDFNKHYPEIKNTTYTKEEKTIFENSISAGYSLISSKNTTIGNGFTLGYEFGIIHSAFSEKISTNIGIYWNYYKMNENFDNMKEIYTIEEIYMIKEMEHYNYFRIPIGAMYRFNNSKISPYLKSGVSLYLYDNFLLNQEIFINAKVGVRIIQKIDVSVEKDFSPSLNIQPINFMHFNVGYIF
jgi:hypothetical protein